jgi:hypothetical protein
VLTRSTADTITSIPTEVRIGHPHNNRSVTASVKLLGPLTMFRYIIAVYCESTRICVGRMLRFSTLKQVVHTCDINGFNYEIDMILFVLYVVKIKLSLSQAVEAHTFVRRRGSHII